MNHLLLIFIDDSPVSTDVIKIMLIMKLCANMIGWRILFSLQPEKAEADSVTLVPFLQKFAEPRNKKFSVSTKKFQKV